MVDLINSQRRNHIVTIEDPIEFMHSNRNSIVEQIEVGTTRRISPAPSAASCARLPT